jgi:hypothetical protein
MSMVVEMREWRICPCTDFGSAPACTIQVAQEVRSERQLTLQSRRFVAGLINRFNTFASFSGRPRHTD